MKRRAFLIGTAKAGAAVALAITSNPAFAGHLHDASTIARLTKISNEIKAQGDILSTVQLGTEAYDDLWREITKHVIKVNPNLVERGRLLMFDGAYLSHNEELEPDCIKICVNAYPVGSEGKFYSRKVYL